MQILAGRSETVWKRLPERLPNRSKDTRGGDQLVFGEKSHGTSKRSTWRIHGGLAFSEGMAADLALVEDQGEGAGQKPIRILVYDGQRFWLAQKRLSKGRFPCGGRKAMSPRGCWEARQAQMLLVAGNPDANAVLCGGA